MFRVAAVGRGLRTAALLALLGLCGGAQAQNATPPTPTPPPAAEQPNAPETPANPPAATPVPTPPAAGEPAPPQSAPAEPPPDGDASNATPIDVTARPVALIRGNATWDDGFKVLTAAFKELDAEVARGGLKANGPHLTVFVETDDNGFHYEAMLPVEKLPDGKESLTPKVRLGQSPAGKAMKFQHRGAYDDIDSTYEAITAYLDEKGLEARNLFVEEYLADMKSADDAATKIDIYVFIK
jgi:effector-binding domain-containing protein